MIHVNSMRTLTKLNLRDKRSILIPIHKCGHNTGKQIIQPIRRNITSFFASWENQKNETHSHNLGTYNFINITPNKVNGRGFSTSKHHEHDSLNEENLTNVKENATEKSRELTQSGMTHAKEGMSKAKILMSKYGYFFVGTYLSVYVGTVSSLYFLLDHGLVDPSSLSIPDWFPSIFPSHGDEEVTLVSLIADLADNFEFTKKYVESIQKRPEFVNLGIAWVATKLTEPIRLGVSIFLTPRIARLFGRKDKD